MTTKLQQLQDDVLTWANAVLPHRTPKDLLLQLHEELIDMAKNPTDIKESGDVLILLVDFIHFYGVKTDKLLEAAEEKMEINKNRKWVIDRRTTITRHA